MDGVLLAAGVAATCSSSAGLSVPPRVLERPLVERVADLIPVALLSALVAVQVFAHGQHLVLDARAAGLGVAVVRCCCARRSWSWCSGPPLVAALVRLL